MQEVLGNVYNLMLDLERIKFLSQENDSLGSDKKMAEIKEETKQYLRQWTERVESAVKHMDLPPEVAGELLELTAEAKNLGSMGAIHIVARKVEAILNDVRAAQNAAKTQARKAENAGSGLDPMAVGAVIGGVALAPFVQVRYTPQAYEEKSAEFVEEKLLPRLFRGDYRPVPSNRTYDPPKVSARPQKAARAEAEIKDLEKDIAVGFMREQAAKKGVKLSEDQALKLWEELGDFAKKHLIRQAKKDLGRDSEKGKLLVQKEEEKEKAYADRFRLNIIKQRKKKERQTAKRQRKIARVKQAEQAEKTAQKAREDKVDAILKAGKVKIRKKSNTKKRTKVAVKQPVKKAVRKELNDSLKERLVRVATAADKTGPNSFDKVNIDDLTRQIRKNQAIKTAEQAVRPAKKRVRKEANLQQILAKNSAPISKMGPVVGKKSAEKQEQLNRVLKIRNDYAKSA